MQPCAPCVPRNIMTMIRMHARHREPPATRAASLQAQPSQREGQPDDNADYQTAYQSARTVSVNGRRGCPIVASGAGPPSRLLSLRGQDTTPAAEQLAAPTPPAMVTMASSVEDKLALYADLFRARTDVYALYWENLRAGTNGWMPAVAGRWRKGMDRRSVRYLPLTRAVIAAHLAENEVFLPFPRCRLRRSDGHDRRAGLREGGSG
jgi:TOTE conflict system, Archaeo-Eukaryotic Primase domain